MAPGHAFVFSSGESSMKSSMTFLGKVSATSLLLSMLVLQGCGPRQGSAPEPVGELSGKVTLKGQPVTGGRLIFASKDGKEVGTIQINTDGTYKGSLPVGELQVAVDTEMVKKGLQMQHKGGGMPAMMMKPSDDFIRQAKEKGGITGAPKKEDFVNPSASELRYVPIPEKYRTAKDSGLTVTIQQGGNTRDFKLD
jgi:hypothetical protein